MDSLDPILLNPDSELNRDGITMVMLCSEEGLTPQGRGSEVVSSMPPTEIQARGRGGGPCEATVTSGTTTMSSTIPSHGKPA